MCRRCSGFLALFIAAFRAFSVLFPMSNAVNFLMKARSGYLIVLIMMVICGAWSSLYRFCTIVVKVTDECFGYTPSWVMYKQDVTGINELRLRAADGYIAIIVCILYFLVAIALVIALYNAKKRRKHLKSDNYFIGQLELFAMTLSIINSIAHCFICFSMSSQYRDVVKGLMCVRTDDEEKIKKAISVKENNTSTVKTTKTTLSSKRTS
uniref:G_PROTEIN_RECEP_F1_2 domain-containing protein n=2 Tax=Caenorhabditis tropicalis TaxID=1561998 RepID=A0A1I7TY83_9PELO